MFRTTDYSKLGNNTSRNIKWKYFLIVIIFLSLAILIFSKGMRSRDTSSNTFLSPISESITEIINPEPKESKLNEFVSSELENTDGRYAVAVKNLKTNEEYYLNENEAFDTASLYKLFVMGTAFEQIDKGTLKEQETLSQKIEVLNEKFDIATESAEKTDGEITLTTNEALSKMITVSDNYSALLLSEKVRIPNVTKFLIKNGLSQSKMGILGGSPITTASDILMYFEKIYRGELIDKKNSDAMLALLKNQKLNNKLPKYLPENIVMAHKTGELTTLSHDSGIVYMPNGAYIIVVLSDTSNPSEANEKMAVISKKIYEYFAN